MISIMRLLASFRRSLFEKGLKITLQKIFSVIEDIYFDKKYGIDTSKIVEVEELGIYDESTRHSSPYQPTRVRHFHQLMKTLEFPIASVFVDFGSGKGRILLLASEYNFKRVVGVEISRQLCEMARRNVGLYETRSERPLNIEVV